MENLLIDDSLRAKLSQFSAPVNLCDSSGKTLGCFFPANDASMYEPVTPLTPEELAERMRSTEWYTTEEVLRHLESL